MLRINYKVYFKNSLFAAGETYRAKKTLSFLLDYEYLNLKRHSTLLKL